MNQKNNSATTSAESERFSRGATVNVEFADGSCEIGGILEWDESGFYRVTIPAEDACRWVPADAVSLFLEKEEDPYQTEEYQRFMAEAAKSCDAEDSPCDSCLAGGVCDGPARLDPLLDSGLDDDDSYDP